MQCGIFSTLPNILGLSVLADLRLGSISLQGFSHLLLRKDILLAFPQF